MDPNRERLKTLNIHQIPVAEKVVVRAGDAEVSAKTSSGKSLPENGPGTAVIQFEVRENTPASSFSGRRRTARRLAQRV